jgi:hypothetical protein
MDVEIDEAGKNQSTAGLNLRRPSGSFEVWPHRDDSARIDQHVGHIIEPSRIDYVPACNKNVLA